MSEEATSSKGPLDLAWYRDMAEKVDSPEKRDACLKIASGQGFLDAAEAKGISDALELDVSRSAALHNLEVASKCADSLSLSTVAHLLEGLVLEDMLEEFLVEAISRPGSGLAGATIDEVGRILRFRPHVLNHRQWAEDVLLSL